MEDGLPFHDRLAGGRANGTESQDRRAVGDDGDEVALVRVLVDVAGVACDLETGHRHAGGVGKRQVPLGGGRLGGNDFGLSGPAALVVFESFVARVVCHTAGESTRTSRKSGPPRRVHPCGTSRHPG